MRLIGKLVIIIFIVGILLGASAYVILYTGENDTEPPQILEVSGDLMITAGQTALITARFTDNVNVTEATLYYKIAGSTNWDTISILSENASISIPSDATSNYYYYITINDAAGNGPVGNPSVDGTTFYTITVNPTGNNSGNETLTHTVFIEEATATWCTNCPNVANILHSIYETHLYDFYYVSLINDSNTDTADRLYTDFNVAGFPTVFIDGGYDLIYGGNHDESVFTNAISTAEGRVVPKIKVTVTAQYKNTTKEVTVNTIIDNQGTDAYNGRLKLYLTEIVSHLAGYDSKPYQFGFLEYLMNKDISVAGKDTATFSETKNISAYDYENLMIIAVVFSSEKQQGYANPLDKTTNLFDAYYADAADATKVVQGGNLPPQLQITSPQKGKIYLNGKPILERLQQRKIFGDLLNKTLHNKTVLLGKKIITVNATDDSAVAQVEFSIDGTIMGNDTSAPYEFTFTKNSIFKSLFFRKHTLTVTVYDYAGKTTSASLLFKARI
jgi:glutaredoxin